jgi:hypothetical protein
MVELAKSFLKFSMEERIYRMGGAREKELLAR